MIDDNKKTKTFDFEKIIEHTNEISRLRKMINNVILLNFENKILSCDYMKKIENRMFEIEEEEVKLRRDVKNLYKILVEKED